MLRSFRVANHKSIRDEQELVLLPAYDKRRASLDVAGIFGPNASGKSNFLDALRFMQSAVRTSFAHWEAGSGVPRKPYRLSPLSAAEPSLFVVDLLLGEIRYTYGFTVDSQRVLEEWLYAYPHRRKRVIFERDQSGIAFGSTVLDYRSRSELVTGLTRDNALALSSAAQANQDVVAPVYEWFRSGLRYGYPLLVGANRTTVAEAILRQPQLIELLKAADFGIRDARVERLLTGGLEPIFLHGPDLVPFRLEDESEGTVAWIGLLIDAIDVLVGGKALVTDEIDTSLHPHLTMRLIDLFQNEETNPLGAQLIFTTHDAMLLSPVLGGDTLERDQVWFIEKRAEGSSHLYALSDFHPRLGENTARRYITGSYGAIPMTSEYAFREAVASAGVHA